MSTIISTNQILKHSVCTAPSLKSDPVYNYYELHNFEMAVIREIDITREASQAIWRKEHNLSVQATDLFGNQLPTGNDSSTIAIGKTITNFLGFHMNRDDLDKSLISNYITIPHESDVFVKLAEDVSILIYDMLKATSSFDRAKAICTYCKLRGTSISLNSLLSIAFVKILGIYIEGSEQKINKVQSLDSLEALDAARKYINSYDSLKKLPIFKKLYKFGLYALSLGIFTKIGITFDNCRYNKIEAEAVKRQYYMGPDFIHSIFDTLTFLLRQGIQCMKSGSIDPIFHSGSTYEAWYEKCAKLQRDATVLSNPHPHGIDRFKFTSDLLSAIEEGNAMKKFASGESFERKQILELVNKLEMIKATELTKKAALRDREAPFSILLFGASSIGKTSLKNAMFSYFGNLHNLTVEPEFMYPRDPANPYWSNFNSTQWCIVLDDIGFLRPGGNAPDPTLMEMLQINNNVSYVPVQADLADKGKTPLLAKLLIGTTNTEHLNVHAYFSCPLAISRRFPFVVNVTPKEQYAHEGMIVGHKLPILQPGELPDFWDFIIKKPLPVVVEGQPDTATLVEICRFDNIHDYLKWFGLESEKHALNQRKAMDANQMMYSVKVCKQCRLTTTCKCLVACIKCGFNSSFCLCTEEEKELHYNSLCHDCNCGLNLCVCRSGEENGRLLIQQNNKRFCSNRVQVGEIQQHLPKIKLLWENALERMSGYFCLQCYNQYDHYCIYTDEEVIFADENGERIVSQDIETSKANIVMQESIYFKIKVLLYLHIIAFMKYDFIAFLVIFFYGEYWHLKLVKKLFGDSTGLRVMFKILGEKIRLNLCSNIYVSNFLIFIASGAVSLIVISNILKTIFPQEQSLDNNDRQCDRKDCFETMPSEVFDEHVYQEKCSSLQSKRKDIGVTPTPMSHEKENVWYAKEEQVIKFALTSKVLCSNLSFDESLNLFANNCVLFRSTIYRGEEKGLRLVRALCLGGNVYVTNNHGLPDDGDPVELEIISNKVYGLNPNTKFIVTPSQILRFPHKDIAYLKLPNLVPRKNLLAYLPSEPITPKQKGVYLTRTDEGDILKREISAISFESNSSYLIGSGPIYKGYIQTPTKDGECGSLLVLDSPMGAIISGLHVMGGNDKIFAISLDRLSIEKDISSFGPIIQAGNISISAPSAPRVIGDIHPKSVVRYCESGNGMYYGTFKGFRNKRKSAVAETLLSKQYEELGYSIKHCAPNMSGWEPWNLALQDMTNPITNLRQDVIDDCVEAFTADILQGLTKEDLSNVVVYDDFTTMNGAAGVPFVEKINRNTSMGNPWKCSKRQFIHDIDPLGGNLDPVMFNEEVMDRVDECIAAYKLKTRYMPIFNGNLKDEAVTYAKFAANKTRVFMGAPAEFTFVQRKYMLSLSRLIQNKRFLFESGPGTICQSIEWEQLFYHVTRFGVDRMVAGDYKAYDKRMPSCIILAAFQILRNICVAAGYSDEELMVIDGIAHDVAFPLVDFNGDLIQFACSNPSGHSFTVIINGLVNCLYMRYCYSILGNQQCRDFKQFVCLFTYGDDNMMSVHQDKMWFNHTSIQACLNSVGIVYTMAEKTAKSIPFIHIRDVSFLKRTFRYDNDIGAYVAPLEHDSIEKMLLINIKSKNLCAEEHSVILMATALREYFWYGKEIFNQKKKMFNKLIVKNNLGYYVPEEGIPSWETLKEAFWKAST